MVIPLIPVFAKTSSYQALVAHACNHSYLGGIMV
jgi:hypothetical protein